MSFKTILPAALLAVSLSLGACGAFEVGLDTPTSPAAAATTLTLSTSAASTSTRLPVLTRPATATVAQRPTGTVAPPAATPLSASPTLAASATLPALATATLEAAEAILILNPGSTSSVVSPVRVAGQAQATFEQNLVVQISDANGVVIATKPTTIKSSAPQAGPFDTSLPFTVSGDQPGRIAVFSTSARDGGLLHLASAEVTLLAGGSATLVAGATNPETLNLFVPAPLAQIGGGHLHVAGYSDYVFEGQLSVALCGEGGSGAPDPVCGTADNVLATGTAKLSSTAVGQPGPFMGDLSYKVTGVVQARLAVYSRSARDGGIAHLNTVNVVLMP